LVRNSGRFCHELIRRIIGHWGEAGQNYDVTSAFPLILQFRSKCLDSIHGWGPTGKREHSRICLLGLKPFGKNGDLVMRTVVFPAICRVLFQTFCSARTARGMDGCQNVHTLIGSRQEHRSFTGSAYSALWLPEIGSRAICHSSPLKHMQHRLARPFLFHRRKIWSNSGLPSD